MVAAIVTAAHWPVLGAQARSLDDDLFLSNNPLVTQPGWPSTRRIFGEVLHPSTVAGYYLPVTMTSLMLDCAMGGSPTDLGVFHRTNLVLHVLATLLVVLILYHLFGSAIPAGIVGLLFGIHPLSVEPVAWVAQRKTLLATCFAFACLWAYVRHRRGSSRWWWVGSIAMFLLGLLSKPSIVTLPLMLLVLDWWPLRRFDRRAVLEKWPFFVLATASSAVAAVSQFGTMAPTTVPDAGPSRMVLQVFYLLIYHLRQIVWPRDLSSLHPPPNPITLANPEILFSVVTVCVLVLVLVLLARRWRGPLASWLCYFVALLPTFGVLAWSVLFVYDNYLYFPAIGIVLMAGAGLSVAWSSPRWRGNGARVALLAPMILAGAAGFLGTRATLRHWQSDDTLWPRLLTILPDFPAMHEKYGTMLLSERPGEAIPHLRRAIELAPENPEFRYNLGLALSLGGRSDAALVEFQAATTLAPTDTGYVRQFARTLRKVGKRAEAEQQFRALLRLKADDLEALGQLATLLAARGEMGEAIELARRGVTTGPGSARTHFTLGLVLIHSGSKAEAVAHLREAVRLESDWPDPYNELAWLLATSPDPKVFDPREALSLSQRAVELSGGMNPGVLDTRAAAQAAAGQYVPAVATAEAAARLADSLGVDPLAKTIRGRIATYRRELRFVEHREAPGTP